LTKRGSSGQAIEDYILSYGRHPLGDGRLDRVLGITGELLRLELVDVGCS
jgi:hypothetical protein